MPKGLLGKLALYTILPCILAFSAVFLNGLFHPQLQWKLKVLDIQYGFYRIDDLETNTTSLFDKPSLKVYEEEGRMCSSYTGVVYIQNKLLQDKSALEKWIGANNGFTYWVTFLAIVHAVANAIYLLKQKMRWGEILVIVSLVTIGMIALISLFGPVFPDLFTCISQVKVEAELTNMSLDGLIYPFLGVILNILAVIVMARRWDMFKQTGEEIP